MPSTTFQIDDIFETTNVGYSTTDSGDKLIVAADVMIFSRDNSAVDASYANFTLINNGVLVSAATSGAEIAVYMRGGGYLVNRPGGIILGPRAIAADNAFVRVDNLGHITGTDAPSIGMSFWHDGLLNNRGVVHGSQAGVTIGTDRGSGTTINNFKRISSDGDAVTLSKSPGDFGTVNNKATGVIRGDLHSIYSEAGKLTVNNLGKLVGDVESITVLQRDVVFNKGLVQGDVRLGSGNDHYDGTGGRVTGFIEGGKDNDRLIGGSLADRIIGGSEKDTVTGRGGADRFIFTSVFEGSVGVTRDVITDFSHVQHDRIDLSVIDANDLTIGPNEAFVFIGAQGFAGYKLSHPGVVGLVRFAGGIVQVTNDADNAAEFEIRLPGVASLVAGDFVL